MRKAVNSGVDQTSVEAASEQPFTVNKEDVRFKGRRGTARRAEIVKAPIKDNTRRRTACVCSRCSTMHEGTRWTRVHASIDAPR